MPKTLAQIKTTKPPKRNRTPAKHNGGMPVKASLMETELPPHKMAVSRLRDAARRLRWSLRTFMSWLYMHAIG